jgi:hypothetical protein
VDRLDAERAFSAIVVEFHDLMRHTGSDESRKSRCRSAGHVSGP